MIRHGETVANAEGFAAGSLDTALTQKGRAQARLARARLESLREKPARIVHSALSRARDTAMIMNEGLCLPMHECAALNERSFGDWVGLPWDGVAARLDAGAIPPNGESMEIFIKRVMGGMAATFALFDDTILFVTHGGVFQALGRSFGRALEDVENCELYGFEPDSSASGRFPWRVLRDPA